MLRITDAGLNDLWRRYHSARQEPSTATAARGSELQQMREQLIASYVPLVHHVVQRMAMSLPTMLDRADLAGYGAVGLIDAVEKYEPRPGIDFESYAMRRVRGAIMDQLRIFDELPRTARSRARKYTSEVEALTQQLGRAPSEDEVAAKLGLSADEYQRILEDLSYSMSSLDTLICGLDGERSLPLLTGLQLDEPTPEQAAADQETTREIADAIGTLPERSRLLLSLYYERGLTMKEIAAVLDISESRICQLHTHALLLLRAQLSGQRRPAAAVA